MADTPANRLENEVALLDAMYPDQTSFSPATREFVYADGLARLCLRLPSTYPGTGSPDVILAVDSIKSDLRGQVKAAMQELGGADGEEALDSLVYAFQQQLVVLRLEAEAEGGAKAKATSAARREAREEDEEGGQEFKTVIVWLHHLLDSKKRKLAVAPPPSSPPVAGLTKPGYPGVLLFSGPAAAVRQHMDTLRAQRWQAFQVRYETGEAWAFTHNNAAAARVREVSSMSELVQAIDSLSGNTEQGQRQKAAFLKAVGIK